MAVVVIVTPGQDTALTIRNSRHGAGDARALIEPVAGRPTGSRTLDETSFRDPAAGQAAGYVLMVAGVLVAGVVLLFWLRGVGSATGIYFLEPFVLANIPAFPWLGWYGLSVGRIARG